MTAVLGEVVATAERSHDVVGLPTCRTPQVAGAAVIASDDRTDFPPLQTVSEAVGTDANLAHEQCIKLMGGCQFFAFSSLLSAVCSAASSALTTSGTLKNASIASLTVLYALIIC